MSFIKHLTTASYSVNGCLFQCLCARIWLTFIYFNLSHQRKTEGTRELQVVAFLLPICYNYHQQQTRLYHHQAANKQCKNIICKIAIALLLAFSYQYSGLFSIVDIVKGSMIYLGC